MKLNRRSKIAIAAAGGLGAAAVALAAVTIAGPASPGLTPACKQAQAAEYAYARWVGASTSYPNDSIEEGLPIMFRYSQLMNNMSKAGCPGTTPTLSLPGG